MTTETVHNPEAGIKQAPIHEFTDKEARWLEAFRAMPSDTQDSQLHLAEGIASFHRRIDPYPDLKKKCAAESAALEEYLENDTAMAEKKYRTEKIAFKQALEETFGVAL